jgi:predicted Holliday junction resolvase-like endonuclease
MKTIALTIIVILSIIVILLFAYIYILTESIGKYDNEHNFRRKEKGYKENNSFVEELYREEKYQNFIKHDNRKSKSND